MATMTISLPEPLREFIESEVSKGNYDSASELFCELLRERQKRKAEEILENRLLEGLESGQPIKVTKKYLDARRKQVQENANLSFDF